MTYRDLLPQPIEDIVTEWIEMDDGCRLAVRIWRPVNAHEVPVPAIVEMIPYRRRDASALQDASRHPYVAAHGYACVRVDIRGTGDSDGIILDEYTERELQDACTVIDWLAKQAWCDGNVGMWGISWGGFNSLQVAAKNPPALKAVITLCASDDRYADDAHYLGGCLIEANLRWGTKFLSETARPPDPNVVGEQWRARWFERLNALELFPEIWMRHQIRDAYWKRGSVCEAFDNITTPVMAVGGWSDAYVNSVATTLAGVRAPKRGLIGPWGHDFPHRARPAPAIGFLDEALRWWDHWLKGRDTGLMDEPTLKVYVLDSTPPTTTRPVLGGHWTYNDTWPPTNLTHRAFHLCAKGLVGEPCEAMKFCHSSALVTGVEGGEWTSWGAGAEFGGDQRPDDGQSLCFDTAAIDGDIEIFGSTTLRLSFSVDQPMAMVAVRLCDVFPQGASTRITLGVLNLTHWHSHESPQALVPGETYTATVRLRDIAYTVPRGHKLRLAISTSYWPLTWPSPKPVTLTVHGRSQLSVPIRGHDSVPTPSPRFEEPDNSLPIAHEVLARPDSTRKIIKDIASGVTTYTVNRDAGSVRLVDTKVTYASRGRAEFEIGADPLSASHAEYQTQVLDNDDWRIRIEASTRLTATAQDFILTGTVEAFESDNRVFVKNWHRRTPRGFV